MTSFKERHMKPWHVYLNICLNMICYLCLILALMYGTTKDYILTIVLYMIIGLNEQAFFHRMLTHRSWDCPRWFKVIGIYIGTLSILGPVYFWVALHRGHHRHTDTEKDPHSPLYISNWRIQFLSSTLKIDPRLAPDLFNDKIIQFFTIYYFEVIFASWFLFMLIFGLSSLLYLLAATGLALLLSNCINTWHHGPIYWFGQYRNKQLLPDTSKNDIIMGYIMFDGWHNNHHTNPNRYYFGEKWWEFDLCGLYIWVLSVIFGYTDKLKR